MNLENRLLRLLGRKHYVPSGADEITAKLKLGQTEAKEVRAELRNLVRLGRVVRLPDKCFALPGDEDLVAGRILMNRRGGGRVVTTDATQPLIDIAPNAARTAMRVVTMRDPCAQGGRKEEPKYTNSDGEDTDEFLCKDKVKTWRRIMRLSTSSTSSRTL